MQKLIKLSDTHYIIVDDSEIKEDWIVDTNDANFIFKITSGYIKDNGHYDWKKYKFKITHSTQPDKGMENVTFISLSEVEELVKDKLFTIEDLRRAFDAGIDFISDASDFPMGDAKKKDSLSKEDYISNLKLDI